jgi:ABC-type transport system involved in multi-copper enzyme maturation permease subunit
MNTCLQPVTAIARYTALEALRTRFVWLALFMISAGFGLGAFSGELAITESTQTQTAIAASVLRMVSVLLVILFVTTSVYRDFSDKSVELMLSLPLPRSGYYLGKLAGYSLVALLVALPLMVLISFFASPSAVLSWGLSLMLELLLVCAVSLMFAFSFNQVTASIAATLLFYLLSRSITAIQLMAHAPLVDEQSTAQQLITALIDGIAYLLPNLEQFTRTDWLLYASDTSAALFPLLTQTVIYLLLLSCIALFDLYRKNF